MIVAAANVALASVGCNIIVTSAKYETFDLEIHSDGKMTGQI